MAKKGDDFDDSGTRGGRSVLLDVGAPAAVSAGKLDALLDAVARVLEWVYDVAIEVPPGLEQPAAHLQEATVQAVGTEIANRYRDRYRSETETETDSDSEIRSETDNQEDQESISKSNSISDCAPVSSVSLRIAQIELFDELSAVLAPASTGDRTCWRGIVNWYMAKAHTGELKAQHWQRILGLAAEARQARLERRVNNERAFFVSLLKKELGYPK